MKILVTGGLGAVGKFLVQQLRTRGHEVWVADLMHHHGPEYVRCDVGEFRQVEQIFLNRGWSRGYFTEKRDFDMVYHLAAEFGRWNGEDFFETLWKSNAVGTKNVLRLQERFGFKAVYFSSSEVYGDYTGLMNEDVMDTVPIKQMNDYAISKWVNEMQVLNSAEQHGTKSVRVRLFNTYGPGEPYSPYRSVICLFIYRALHNKPFVVNRGHHRTSTYIADTAATLANIADNFVPGNVYNIGGLDYHTIEEAAELIIRHTACDPELAHYAEPEPFTTLRKEVDCQRAVRDLKHKTTVTLDEGIRRTVAWMREYYLGRDIVSDSLK
ncbi:MAG: NAD-dependent epimerase/dehydratase family protein [Gemmatimonadaceae bacterium]